MSWSSVLITTGAGVLGMGAYADLDAIDRQVAAFTGAPIGAVGGAMTPLDRRLKLNRCQTTIALSWRTAGKDSVVVQCADQGGWRLFVPVRAPAPVASVAQARDPDVVNRGDALAIAVTGDGFTVSQPGEALESGPIGAWIKVRPASGKRGSPQEMRAQIVRPGLVSVPLP
ncbi:flagella basal body P-ring formation protein FlgA [Novosphingobium sp. 1949]|uniref:Flagella basal body P-ring formation protein FlgA n=1 Tax=Novosphingobium organovorum TaxID=2930092 RepID=A0ABT0BIV0_9SPHN|nr:flagella basal body P-ring formation protein FlgA [Novosphingobium organovorum]MCJ2184939.1 flagella basal body P-ring formation protein FlgA [Novosphingobium organovorum]